MPTWEGTLGKSVGDLELVFDLPPLFCALTTVVRHCLQVDGWSGGLKNRLGLGAEREREIGKGRRQRRSGEGLSQADNRIYCLLPEEPAKERKNERGERRKIDRFYGKKTRQAENSCPLEHEEGNKRAMHAAHAHSFCPPCTPISQIGGRGGRGKGLGRAKTPRGTRCQ